MSESIKQRTGALAVQGGDAYQLRLLLEAARTELVAIRALANELRTDHATFKTAVDQTKTLIDELHDDHATSVAVIADVKTLANDIRAKLQGNYILSEPGLAIGSTTTAVSNAAFYYVVAGKTYYKAAVANGTAPGNDVIPQAKYGAVAFDIGSDGTIDAVEATDNATGYDSAVLALAGLPAAAAGHARIGTVTATKSDGAFTFGTTDLNAANTTVAYASGTSVFNAIGAAVSTSPPATLTASKPAAGPATLTATATTEILAE